MLFLTYTMQLGGTTMLTMFRKNKVEIPAMSSNIATDNVPHQIHDIMKFIQLTKDDLYYLTLIDDIMEENAENI